MSNDPPFAPNEAIQGVLAAIGAGHAGHAYIIEGRSPDDSEEAARTVAAALLCGGEGLEPPCGFCPHCRKNDLNIHPDLIVIEPEEGKKSISVDQIKGLRLDLYVAPNEAERKVYIIKEAARMTAQAQNALLKSLEEPPPFAAIILTAAVSEALLPPVLSRAVRLVMGPRSGLYDALKEDFPDADDGTLREAALLSRGSAGEAKRILEEPLVEDIRSFCTSFFTLLADRRHGEFSELSEFFIQNREKYDMIMNMLKLWTRDIMAVKCGGDENALFYKSRDRIKELSRRFTMVQLIRIYDELTRCNAALLANANRSLTLLTMFAHCWEVLY